MSNYGLLTLREKLNCRPSELASLLQISRPLLAHVQKGTREPDMETIKAISLFDRLLEKRRSDDWKSNDVQKLLDADTIQSNENLEALLANTKRLWQKSLVELVAMKKDYQRCIDAMQNISFFLKNSTELNPKQKKWAEEQLDSEKKKFSEINLSAQQELHLRSLSLEADIHQINQLLGTEFDLMLESFKTLQKYTG